LHAATRLLGRLHPPDAAGQVAWLAERLGHTTAEVTRDLTEALTAAAPGRDPSTDRRFRAVVHNQRSRRAAHRFDSLE
jgi:hypothetical protein